VAAAAETALKQPAASCHDGEVQSLPEPVQLLDLVQTLIADHRYSMLERQRLQQQLEATQQALQVVKLDKDRAVVLADFRCGWLLTSSSTAGNHQHHSPT